MIDCFNVYSSFFSIRLGLDRFILLLWLLVLLLLLLLLLFLLLLLLLLLLLASSLLLLFFAFSAGFRITGMDLRHKWPLFYCSIRCVYVILVRNLRVREHVSIIVVFCMFLYMSYFKLITLYLNGETNI